MASWFKVCQKVWAAMVFASGWPTRAHLPATLPQAPPPSAPPAQTGRGKAHLVRPRFSGLMGDSVSGGFRWERDVLRLEKVVVQQERSR